MPEGSATCRRLPVVLSFEPCGLQALPRLLELLGARERDLEPAQPEGAGRGRRRSLAGPRVDADVVVVAAGGEEQRAGVAADGDLEAERAGVEVLGRGELGDVEVDVPDPRSHGHPVRLGVCGLQLAEDAVEVERQGVHLQLAVGVAPLLARAVPVDLDPVALRVAEVERLADQVVGGAR